MEIKYKTWEDDDCREFFRLEVDGNEIIHISDYLSESSEDATICRSLSFVTDIPNLLKEIYEAGKRGEELIFSEFTEAELDDL